jgi:release factor glutamine methyltransferase
MSDNPKTVLNVLQGGADFLQKKGIEDPRLVCEMLLARLLSCKRLELYLKYDEVLSEKKLEAMRRGIKRAAAGEPVQYILGETGFRNAVFKVDRRALIPRPETELLVEHVLACEALWQGAAPAIVDVGTGSGCIILSLAAERPHGRYLALDASEEALSLARENAATLDLTDTVHFAHADLSDVVDPESVDAVVANLPYIPSADCEHLDAEIRDHEPRMALDGGPNGLNIIETVVQDAAIVLKNGGMLFLEIGDDQGAEVVSLLKQSGFSETAVKQDLNGRDRVVLGKLEIGQ